MTIRQSDLKSKWNSETSMDRSRGNSIPPSYPNEFLVKIFSSSYYSGLFEILQPGEKVLDVGCGFANNLVYFMDRGLNAYGVEVNEETARLARDNLSRLGYEGCQVSVGHNEALPFEDRFFDILLSVNTIHYSEGAEGIARALLEFKRVIKPRGRLFIATAGPLHVIRTQSDRLGEFNWKVKDFGFRSGHVLSFFDDPFHLERTCKRFYSKVELGRLTEHYPTVTLDFMLALCSA